MKRTFSLFMLTLLLVSMLTVAFNIQTVKADPKTWIVDDDGPADFHTIQEAINAASDGDIVFVRNGTYYENVIMNRTILLIGEERETTVIDAGGVGSAITVEAANASIQNVTMQNAPWRAPQSNIPAYGVLFDNLNCTFSNNIIRSCMRMGLFGWGDGLSMINNTVYDCTYGVVLYNAGFGLTVLRNNSILLGEEEYGVRYGLRTQPLMNVASDYSLFDVDATNTIDGRPVFFINNAENLTINERTFPDFGHLFLANANNVNIVNVSIPGGLQLYNSRNVKFENCTIENVPANQDYNNSTLFESNKFLGSGISGDYDCDEVFSDNTFDAGSSASDQISLRDSIRANITHNIFRGNMTNNAISLWGTTDSIISDNTMGYASLSGIFCEPAERIVIRNNSIEGAGICGIRLNAYGCVVKNNTISHVVNKYRGGDPLGVGGIWATAGAANNSISMNSFSECGYGIVADDESNHNLVFGNTFTNNTIGLEFSGYASDNHVYHNNFIDNTQQILLFYSGTNFWENGYPSGGNYWSDYSGADLFSGPYQNGTGSDGISDLPYVIDGVNQDKYPFMSENGWETPPISIESNVTVTDMIANEHSLNFTVSGPTGEIGYVNATVPVGLNATQIIVFVDDVQPSPPFPTITSNSTHYFIYFEFTLSTHNISIQYKRTIPGDVNADGIVDIFDITTVALAFSSIPGDSNWNPVADINNDQLVDIFDIVVVALHFGETG